MARRIALLSRMFGPFFNRCGQRCHWRSLGTFTLLLASSAAAQHKIVFPKSDHIKNAENDLGLLRSGTNLLTYHNDSQRTGWNQTESTLTPANVTPATFGLLATIDVDDKVDTQPLVVADQEIEGHGVHTVVYIATEGNTVFAIDSSTGQILARNTVGAPVPNPLDCNNNGRNVGINGTPAIDLQTHTLYVVAYTLEDGKPSYQLHALSLSSLKDQPGSPVTVSALHHIGREKVIHFNPEVQRQRSALLLANGNVYAAFASFCDYQPDLTRGWLLGWNARTLAPLPANELTNSILEPHAGPGKVLDTQFGSALNGSNAFRSLSSIWMSGYGVAADSSGNLYFTTGNSEYRINTYNRKTNIEESAVKLQGDLSKVLDLFTPSNFLALDRGDGDFGSGGLMVLPDLPGPVPHVAVAAGKDGRMFILNRDQMGGLSDPDKPAQVQIGACWCGPSYYQGFDGVARVVSSGGQTLMTWKVNTVLKPALMPEASGAPLSETDQDGGFFTTVSSNGVRPNTAIIWAVGRPPVGGDELTLIAYNGTATGHTLKKLWSGAAGSWLNPDGNAFVVPTVANGKVYVASYHHLLPSIGPTGVISHHYPGLLSIFGVLDHRSKTLMQVHQVAPRVTPLRPPLPGASYWGVVQRVTGSAVSISLRNKKTLQIDLGDAVKLGRTIDPQVGMNVLARGVLRENGTLQCRSMMRAKGPGSWGKDKAE